MASFFRNLVKVITGGKGKDEAIMSAAREEVAKQVKPEGQASVIAPAIDIKKKQGKSVYTNPSGLSNAEKSDKVKKYLTGV